MKITSIHDIEKLLSTAEVSEQFIIEQSKVLEACTSGRFTKDEAVETSIGWLITPEGAARLWQPRESIEDMIRKALTGKSWPADSVEKGIKETVKPLLSTERRRRCKVTQENPSKVVITFKDVSLAAYADPADTGQFRVIAVSPLKDTVIYSCPRGIKNEIFRETYPTPYEAQQRIDSFQGQEGWAQYPEAGTVLTPIGERVMIK